MKQLNTQNSLYPTFLLISEGRGEDFYIRMFTIGKNKCEAICVLLNSILNAREGEFGHKAVTELT